MDRSWGRHRHAVPVAMFPFAFFGMGVAGVVALAVGLAVVATVVVLVFSAAIVAVVFGLLGFIALQVVRHALPGLRARRRDRRGRRRDEDEHSRSLHAETPVDVLRRRYAAGEIGQTAFRRQLADLLKERYVRGDLTLAEFETRVQHLYRDPALQPPA